MMFPDANDDKQRAELRLAAQRAAAAGSGSGESARGIENSPNLNGAAAGMGRNLTSQTSSWSSQQR